MTVKASQSRTAAAWSRWKEINKIRLAFIFFSRALHQRRHTSRFVTRRSEHAKFGNCRKNRSHANQVSRPKPFSSWCMYAGNPAHHHNAMRLWNLPQDRKRWDVPILYRWHKKEIICATSATLSAAMTRHELYRVLDARRSTAPRTT